MTELKYAKLKLVTGGLLLLEDYTNHCGDEFKKGETLVQNKLGQLHRAPGKLGGPAIAYFDLQIDEKTEQGKHD